MHSERRFGNAEVLVNGESISSSTTLPHLRVRCSSPVKLSVIKFTRFGVGLNSTRARRVAAIVKASELRSECARSAPLMFTTEISKKERCGNEASAV